MPDFERMLTLRGPAVVLQGFSFISVHRVKVGLFLDSKRIGWAGGPSDVELRSTERARSLPCLVHWLQPKLACSFPGKLRQDHFQSTLPLGALCGLPAFEGTSDLRSSDHWLLVLSSALRGAALGSLIRP
jgi:hypothetical protein